MLEYIVRGTINFFSKNRFQEKEEEKVMEKISQLNSTSFDNQDLLNITFFTSFDKSNNIKNLYRCISPLMEPSQFEKILISDRPSPSFAGIVTNELISRELSEEKFSKPEKFKQFTIEFVGDQEEADQPYISPSIVSKKRKNNDVST